MLRRMVKVMELRIGDWINDDVAGILDCVSESQIQEFAQLA